ncbi:MAG TPA: extracellular solute-binding protein [Feifaniaceae bacterium]|nr:extracellular solute-binding protein [Feifaniaceae bacterium]
MKKIGCLLVAVLMAASLLTACASQTSNSPDSPSSTSPSPSAPPSGSGEEAAAPLFGTPEDPVVVTYLCKDLSPTDEDVIAYCEKLYENMSKQGMYIKLEILEAPAGTYGEVVPLTVRTGQIAPDIIYFQGGDLAVSQEGLLEDLRPYVESSTYVKELMQGFTATRLQNYPYLLYLNDISVKTPVIRGDILEKLQSADALIADPTIENYYNFMKEIVEGGYSKYALTMDGSFARLDSLFNHAFGVTSTIMKVDGKWVYGKTTEFEKNKLEFYAKLYAEGILDPEYITKGWEEMEQSFYTGETSMILGTCGAVIDVYNTKITAEQGEAAQLVALPPAKGVTQSFEAIDVSKETRGRSIYANSPNKDAAWAVMEYMASPEGRVLDLLGVEGIHYNVEDGKIVRTDKAGGWWSRFFGTSYNFDPNPPLATPLMSEPALDTLALAQQYASDDINIIVPNELAANWDAMNSLYNDFAADVIRGNRPISDFDSFVQEWNAASGDAFSEYLAGVLG